MALNAIELGVLTTKPSSDGIIHITLEVAEECIQRRAIRYDKQGDNHYDTISAFIKSMRGSDPDAGFILSCENDRRGRERNIYLKKNNDMCVRGCRDGRSQCDMCCYGVCAGS